MDRTKKLVDNRDPSSYGYSMTTGKGTKMETYYGVMVTRDVFPSQPWKLASRITTDKASALGIFIMAKQQMLVPGSKQVYAIGATLGESPDDARSNGWSVGRFYRCQNDHITFRPFSNEKPTGCPNCTNALQVPMI